ncbi:MAG TPA: hypothetical protein VFR02_02635, partial [bacterium]|nr:hypothetical protein [bacterium]
LGARAASGKALASWGGLRLLFLRPEPATVMAGSRLQLNYGWERLHASPADGAEWVAVYFTDPAGDYPLKDGLLWFHDIHAPFGGGEAFGALAPGRAFGETRFLFVPSDLPPGRYRLWVALQRPGQAPRLGREAFAGDFYDRAAAEDLEKFTGRPGAGSFTQYAPEDSRSAPNDFLPLASPGGKDGVFAPAGQIEVTAPGAP